MSIIENSEKYMKRYDYLIQKRERKYRERKRLSPEEDEELQKLRPNVFTPIFMMFELLYDTVKTNQERRTAIIQKGGASAVAVAPAPAVAAEAGSANPAEARRLSELEESLLPLLTKIIIYIEENKKAGKRAAAKMAKKAKKTKNIRILEQPPKTAPF